MYRIALSTSLKVSVLSIALVGSSMEVRAEVETSVESRVDADSTPTKRQLSQSFWRELSQAIERKDLKRARTLVEGVELNALSPDARSAIKAIQVLLQEREALLRDVEPAPKSTPIEPKTGLPYGAFSRTTNERISRSTFESLDHMSTLFTQGISAGISLLNTEIFNGSDEGAFLIPAVSGTAYALFGAYTLSGERISRGDIPLIDGISVYLPIHAVLLTNSIFWDDINWDTYPWLFTGTSLASLPLSYYLSQQYDPDPGDAQLIRDSFFWGGLYGWGLYFALHPDDSPEFGRGFPITVLTSSLLSGCAGYWLATKTEYSLERIRATTLGGYFGGVVGGLLALSIQTDSVRGATTLMMLTSSLGALIGFNSTDHLDQIPEGAALIGDASADLSVGPGPLAFRDPQGRLSIRPGLVLSGRF